MRSVKITFCSIFLLFTIFSCASIGLGKSEIVVQIVDENQIPIAGANVSFSFRNYPQDDKIETVTNQNGIAQVKKKGSRRISITVEKTGYYYSDKVIEFDNGSQFQNNNASIYEILIKKKSNPVPMFIKGGKSASIPIFNQPVGYDLTKGDWVSPYGEGETNDFIFNCKFQRKDYDNAEASCNLSFSNRMDGIQEYSFDSNDRSSYKWPFEAPTENYKKSLYKWMTVHFPNEGYKSNIDNKINYIFRVRSKLNKERKIASANYGKIKGDFLVSRKGKIKFFYYLNPDGTRNLEEDLNKNLLQNER